MVEEVRILCVAGDLPFALPEVIPVELKPYEIAIYPVKTTCSGLAGKYSFTLGFFDCLKNELITKPVQVQAYIRFTIYGLFVGNK